MSDASELTPAPWKLQRLIDQVERLQLHVDGVTPTVTPREWLIRWLGTPQPDLNHRKPAHFLADDDFDLILVGLLIRARTLQVWRRTPVEDTACDQEAV